MYGRRNLGAFDWNTWDEHHEEDRHPPTTPCPRLPGTLVRIFIPAGAVINLLNLIEVSSPSGVCLIVRIPALGGGMSTSSLVQAVQAVGGSVEFME